MAAALWTDPELEAGVTLDGVVAVVDAHNIQRQLGAPAAAGVAAANEAQQQIAFADVVLLNKVLQCVRIVGAPPARGEVDEVLISKRRLDKDMKGTSAYRV